MVGEYRKQRFVGTPVLRCGQGVTRGRDPICETNGGQMSLDRFGMLESVTTCLV